MQFISVYPSPCTIFAGLVSSSTRVCATEVTNRGPSISCHQPTCICATEVTNPYDILSSTRVCSTAIDVTNRGSPISCHRHVYVLQILPIAALRYPQL